MNVAITPIWDGPPVEGNTPDLIGARITVSGADPVLAVTTSCDGADLTAEVDLPLAAAASLFGHLGDFLRAGGRA